METAREKITYQDVKNDLDREILITSDKAIPEKLFISEETRQKLIPHWKKQNVTRVVPCVLDR